MGKMKWSAAAVAVIAAAACGDAAPDADRTDAAQQPAQQPATQVGAGVELPEGVTLDMVQQGKTVFETTTCYTCHGIDGSGSGLAPNLRDQEWLNSDGSFDGIMGVVRNGVQQPVRYPGAMPPMGGANLAEDQVRAVSAYVYAISHGG